MSIFISIVAFFLIIFLAVLVHETGHYVTAKVSGVKVEEFGIGLPPRIWGFHKGETLYSINWIPLGGFCRMAGEVDPDVPRSLAGKSVKVRLLVLSAGSIFMLLFPLFLLPASYMTPIPRPAEDGGVYIGSVDLGSPAWDASLQSGDIILRIDGQDIYTLEDVHKAVEAKEGSEVTLVIARAGSEFEVNLVPRTEDEIPEGQGPLGIQMSLLMETRIYPPWEAIPQGFRDYGEIYLNVGSAFGMLFRGDVPLKDAIVGPVGIAHITRDVASTGTANMIRLTVIILALMGIFNLLPIPGLDGGHLVFVVIEGIRRGKRISPRRESLVHFVGFALLIGLVVAITYNDILRLVEGKGFTP